MFKEKFVIHSTMGQDEIRKKIEENVQASVPFNRPFSFPIPKYKYYTGKIDGYNFELQKFNVGIYGGPFVVPSIVGKVKGNYITIEMELHKLRKYLLFSVIGFIFLICIIFLLVILSIIRLDNGFIEFLKGLFILCIALLFRYKMEITREKAHLEKLFNGTIEKVV